MSVIEHGGALKLVTDAIAQAAGNPEGIARVYLTSAEMKEIKESGAFRDTVSKYYGDSQTMIMDKIVTDSDGNFLSFYMGGVLFAQQPELPPYAVDLIYPALSLSNSAAVPSVNSKLLDGVTPSTGYVTGTSAILQLGLAVFAGESTKNLNVGGLFTASITNIETWNIATSVAANRNGVKPTDLYDIYLDLKDEDDENIVSWNLRYSKQKGFVWGLVAKTVFGDVFSSADEDKVIVQSVIPANSFDIRTYVADTELNTAGSPIGLFAVVLRAVPRFGDNAPVQIEARVNVVKKP